MSIYQVEEHRQKKISWDSYFYNGCVFVSSRSRCLSRSIGALIVSDNTIISTGYNGPPRGFPHCISERLKIDKHLEADLVGKIFGDSTCPRRSLGFSSGQGLEICPAAHAESNAISHAARLGVSVKGASLYLNAEIPCKSCMGLIINSGISEVICTEIKPYDYLTDLMVKAGLVRVRRFLHLGG